MAKKTTPAPVLQKEPPKTLQTPPEPNAQEQLTPVEVTPQDRMATLLNYIRQFVNRNPKAEVTHEFRLAIARAVTEVYPQSASMVVSDHVRIPYNAINHGIKAPAAPSNCGPCIKAWLNNVHYFWQNQLAVEETAAKAKAALDKAVAEAMRPKGPMFPLQMGQMAYLISEDFNSARVVKIHSDNGTEAFVSVDSKPYVVTRTHLVVNRHMVEPQAEALKAEAGVETSQLFTFEDEKALPPAKPKKASTKALPAWVKVGATVTDGEDEYSILSIDGTQATLGSEAGKQLLNIEIQLLLTNYGPAGE